MFLSPKFDEALVYAAQAHREQLRKETEIPYVAHLLAVTGIVLEYGGSETEAIAALLHDAVEDQGGKKRLADIRQRFGVEVAEIVAGCTDADVIPKPPWRARKEAYIAHVATASKSVRLVSAADKLANARSIIKDYRVEGERVWTRFSEGRDGTLWYYQSLAIAFKQAGDSPLVQELARAVREMKALATP